MKVSATGRTGTNTSRIAFPTLSFAFLKRLNSQLELIATSSQVTNIVNLLLAASWTIKPRANTGKEPARESDYCPV
ncbi:hypothetical protein ACFLYR_08795 [Chloroflexota bacterium]